MKLLECHDRQDWDDYVVEHGGHPLQLSGWGDVKTAHGWTAHRIFLYDTGEQVVGAAQILVRHLPWPLRSLSYVPRGPVVDELNGEETLTELAKYAKYKYHSVALTIEPDSKEYTVPKHWRQSSNTILPARTIILDLTKAESDLLGDMAKKTRQYIRKSGTEKFVIKRVNNRQELDKCLAVYHATSKRAGFGLHDDQYYSDVFDKMGDFSPVFAAYVDDQPIAFLWLAISADTAYELYGGMNEDGQNLRANYALKWYAILKCREWGLKRYDFGGLLDGGIATFKKGWATDETMLAGTFDRPLSVSYIIWNRGLPFAKAVIRRIKALLGRH